MSERLVDAYFFVESADDDDEAGRAKNKHQRLIVKVHGLLKQRININDNAELSDDERAAQLAAIEAELATLGGMEAYQSASKRGEKHLNSAQWIARAVHEFTTPQQRARCLWTVDVGALEPNYGRWSWINAVSLDLTKRHPFVLEMDFLRAQLGTLWGVCHRQALRRRLPTSTTTSTTSAGTKRSLDETDVSSKRRRADHDDDDDDDDEEEEEEVEDEDDDDVDYFVTADTQPSDDIVPEDFAGFDLVAMSLVLNFEPSAAKRGQMLCKARSLLRRNGFLAIVLPLATIDNSRYFDETMLMELMGRLEFVNLVLHRSPKLFYALFQLHDRAEPLSVPAYEPMPREQVRHKVTCNNFHIELE